MRPTFSDFAAAKREAETVARNLSSIDAAVLKLTSTDRAAYLRALELLKPFGLPIEVAAAHFADAKRILGDVLLSKAAEFYVHRHPKGVQPRRVREVVKEMLEFKRQDGNSDGYLRHLRYDLEKFASAIDYTINEIAGGDIDTWLRSLDVSPRTRNNLRGSVQTLFSYAKAKGYLPKDNDEMDAVPVAKDKGGDIEIFTPAEMAELLSNAPAHLVPFLALGAFAGVRHAEIQRLGWEDIKLQDGIIEIRAANAKTASRRTIPILDNLKAWLLPHWMPAGPICRRRNMAEEIIDLVKSINDRRQTSKTLGQFEWKRNGVRHSYISYRVAAIQNVAQVALEAGNSPQMIFSNYRELVRPADAARWFSIVPPNPETVIPMPKPGEALGHPRPGLVNGSELHAESCEDSGTQARRTAF
jgi:integrase